MTRVNCVPPEELTRQHLIAEYRELPRIFGLVRAAIARGENPNDKRNPPTYTLGTGHCRFFYNKLLYLKVRQMSLMEEMAERGYIVNFQPPSIAEFGAEWCEGWGLGSET